MSSNQDEKFEISHIYIEGFKSLGNKTTVKVAPITVLSGVNSSGKSSFFQPFLLLKQTQEAVFNPNGILLDGPNIKIYQAIKILSEKIKNTRSKNLKIGFVFDNKMKLENVYQNYSDDGFNIKCSNFFNDKEHSTLNSSQKIFGKKFSIFLPAGLMDAEFFRQGKLKPKVKRNRGFLDLELNIIFESRKDSAGKKSKVSTGGYVTGGAYFECIKKAKGFVNLLHIPGIRGNPERSYKFTSTDGRYTGRFEDYTASIIYQWLNDVSGEGEKKHRKLVSLLKRLGLTSSIKAKKLDDVHIVLEVGALPVAKASNLSAINIADVGFGVSQVLPILVGLLEKKKNQTIYIEQPELHLHPKAQSVLAEILCEFANKDSSIIFETHSSIMLRRIQTLVAQKQFKPDDVSFNWFSMMPNGLSSVSTAKLDALGRYGDWPQDFDESFMDVESDYLRAIGKSISRGK